MWAASVAESSRAVEVNAPVWIGGFAERCQVYELEAGSEPILPNLRAVSFPQYSRRTVLRAANSRKIPANARIELAAKPF